MGFDYNLVDVCEDISKTTVLFRIFALCAATCGYMKRKA